MVLARMYGTLSWNLTKVINRSFLLTIYKLSNKHSQIDDVHVRTCLNHLLSLKLQQVFINWDNIGFFRRPHWCPLSSQQPVRTHLSKTHEDIWERQYGRRDISENDSLKTILTLAFSIDRNYLFIVYLYKSLNSVSIPSKVLLCKGRLECSKTDLLAACSVMIDHDACITLIWWRS